MVEKIMAVRGSRAEALDWELGLDWSFAYLPRFQQVLPAPACCLIWDLRRKSQYRHLSNENLSLGNKG